MTDQVRSPADPSSGKPEAGPSPVSSNVPVPQGEFIQGIVAAVVAFATTGLMNAIGGALSGLVPWTAFAGICALLFAVGAAARVVRKEVVLGGAAAAYPVLLFLYFNLAGVTYADIRISNVGDAADVSVTSGASLGVPFPGTIDARTRSYRFLVISKAVATDRFQVLIGGDNTERPMLECGDMRFIQNAMGTGRVEEWRYDERLNQITRRQMDGEREIVARQSCDDDAGPGGGLRVSGLGGGFGLIGSALAQGSDGGALPPVSELIRGLDSPEPEVRRWSRAALAATGVPAVEPVLQAMRAAPDDYMIRLGAMSALFQMVRDAAATEAELAKLLTDADLDRVFAAALDDDPATRVNAIYLMQSLPDPRVVELATARLVLTSPKERDANNMLLILSETVSAATPAQMTRLKAVLVPFAAAGGRSTEVIARIERVIVQRGG